MMETARRTITPEEYLALERPATEKHEYFQGTVIEMSGAGDPHNTIAGNLIGELYAALKGGPCRVYPRDMRVWSPRTESYTYPDASVVCGAPRFADSEADILMNPVVVVEILSPSTERKDRGGKMDGYLALNSLQQYILVAQHIPHIEVYSREPSDWRHTHIHGIDAMLPLSSVHCRVALRDIYDRVLLPSEGQGGPKTSGNTV